MAEQNTEITLGTGRLLGLFFGLVALCAVFFLMGYSLGRSSAVPPGASAGNGAGTATASDAPPKPMAAQGIIPPKPDCATTAEGCPEAAVADTAAPADTTTAAGSPASAVNANAAPDMKAPLSPPEITGTPLPAGYYIVQVAAVSKQQDAEALVAALRKKQYAVFITTPGSDSLFHVQIGPFADPKEAESVRSRLIADGYNPILKK